MTAAVTPGSAELIASIATMLEGHSFGLRRGEHHEEVAARIVDEVLRRLAATPDEDGVRELNQRIHNLRVTLSSVVTLAESAPVSLKTQNAIAKAAKHSLDRDASATTGKPKP